MRKGLMIVALMFVVLSMAACGGSSSIVDPPPSTFDRMTATVQGADGAPLADMTVRVEGQPTGQRTNADGVVVLTAAAFPRGVEASNEISFGRNGLVVGTQTVIPSQTPNPTIRFGVGEDANPNEFGAVTGTVFDETTEQTLSRVEINLFSPNGGVLATVSTDGSFSFPRVAVGTWQLSASKDGYHPEMAQVVVNDQEETVQMLAMTPEGVITPGDGVLVRGVLTDSESGAAIGGAIVSLLADTGYMGVPEPYLIDDISAWEDDNNSGWSGNGEGVQSSPGSPVEPRTPSLAPWHYEPQYLETTTNGDGSFEFAEEVLGYSLWLDFSAEGYLPGDHYEDIYGQQGTVDLTLTLEPFVATSVNGTVVDELGAPVEGAYVEFIYAGDWGGVMPMIDIAMPGMQSERMFEEGMETWDTIGMPAPPMAPDMDGDDKGGWADAAFDVAPEFGGETNGSNSGGSANGVDNPWMQQFRFEQRNAERGASDAAFTGYYSMVTDAEGKFNFENMPTGEYWVFADAYRHIQYNDMHTLDTDPLENSTEIVLENVPVGSVEGYVTDESGTNMFEVLVNATQPNVDPFSYTDSTGYYRIDNIPVGNWIISGYKSGYLTVSFETEITEGGVSQINLVLPAYEPPTQTLIDYTGHLEDGAEGSGVAGADMVFTPVDPELGGYYQHVVTGSGGVFNARLIPTEYNLLIQKEGFEDLYIRIWVDSEFPSMDYWLWPIGSAGGPWGGWLPMPVAADPMLGMDQANGGGDQQDAAPPSAPTAMPERGDKR